MSSRSGVVLGRQVPRLAFVPDAEWSHAADAAFLASSYGLTPDEWQLSVLESWLGARRDGRWASTTCGLAVPRQNGKNAILEIRELYGMVELGEKILHTAHEVKTARKAFLRLRGFFENERKYPELADLVVEIRKANGQEAIILTNGGSVEFVARSTGSGRGFTVDVLVCDEAQQLGDEALEALAPTISAAPTGNPQRIFTGTPPSEKMNGEVFTRTRQTALLQKSKRISWHEWSVDEHVDLEDLNLDDRRIWADVNPAYGDRLSPDVILDERGQFSDDGFARERLGRWDPLEGVDSPISLSVWQGLSNATATEAAMRVKGAVAVEVSLDRRTSIAGASALVGGKIAVELLDRRIGTNWVVEACLELKKHGVPFVIDGGGPAGSLIRDMETAGLNVVVASGHDVAAAYSMLVDAVAEGEIVHGPQPELDAAVAGARKRRMGDGPFTFGRLKSTADVTPLVAVMLAHWLAKAGPQRVPQVWSLAEMVAEMQAEQDASGPVHGRTGPVLGQTPANSGAHQRPDGSWFTPLT